MANSYIYNVEQDTVVGDLLKNKSSIFLGIDITKFFEMEFEGINNFDRISQFYDEDFYKTHKSDFRTERMLILAGTNIAITKNLANIEVVALNGKNLFQEQGDFNTFISNRYIELINDPDYIQDFLIETRGRISAIYKNYNVSVWIWCRALNRIIDASPYVNNMNTAIDMMNGGSFNFILEGILADNEKPEEPISSSIQARSNTISYARYVEDESQTTPTPYFHRWIQRNDLVFIRFESLRLETDRNENRDTFVDKNRLPEKIYDMIGLVDSCNYNFDGTSESSSVNISGRDFMKLLTDDGSWFYPLQFMEGSETLFYNVQQNNSWFRRNFVNGSFENLFVYSMRSIKNTIGFIINQLSNLGAVDNDVLSAYKDDRTEVVRIGDNNLLEWNKLQGVWQIINVLIDDNVSDRRVANSQISRPDGNLKAQIDKICQRPFVEFFGDTYGDKYEFIVRQPPFTKSQVQKYISENDIIEIELKDVDGYTLDWDNSYYSWYQINPQGVFLGNNEQIALAYIPIVFFPRIAEIFGNNRMVVTDNYFSQQAFNGNENKENRDKFKESIINDFIYLIESNCYLPFTRKGRINIDRDRRIKVGTWVRFKPTGEIFYVDGVKNGYSCTNDIVDGGTVVNVSRGMVEKYVLPKESLNRQTPLFLSNRPIDAFRQKPFTYWDIVNINKIKQTLVQKLTHPNGNQQQQSTQNTTKANFGLNDNVFNFFLNRRQYEV